MHQSNNYQHLVINQKGIIAQSNDQLFSSEKINHPDANDLLDFASSILPQVFELLEVQKSITFNGVDISFKLLPGTYDFIFSKNTSNDQPLVDCWIIDRTEYYEDAQQFKQLRNEAKLNKAV